MNIQQLFKIENGVPQWFNIVLWALFLIAIYFVRYWWKHWGSLWFKQKADEIINEQKRKQEEIEKLVYAIRDNEIDQDHWSMEQIVDKCHRKGYRNNEDRKDFMMIYHHYKDKLKGNTDGEVLLKDFIDIPYKTETKVPEQMGIDNPSEEAIKLMLDFYNSIKNKIIDESDIKPIKTKTEFVNKNKEE